MWYLSWVLGTSYLRVLRFCMGEVCCRRTRQLQVLVSDQDSESTSAAFLACVRQSKIISWTCSFVRQCFKWISSRNAEEQAHNAELHIAEMGQAETVCCGGHCCEDNPHKATELWHFRVSNHSIGNNDIWKAAGWNELKVFNLQMKLQNGYSWIALLSCAGEDHNCGSQGHLVFMQSCFRWRKIQK